MQLYEKVRKTDLNKYGLSVVSDNPFLKPTVLLIMSSELYSSLLEPLNGGLKKVLQMARLMNNSFASKIYDPYDFPVRFVTVHALSNKEENWSKRLVYEYLSPLFANNNQRFDLITAKRNIRNLNIISFCAGINYCDDIEKNIIQLLKELKYQDDEIEEILREVFLMGFSSPFLKETSKFSSIIFNDINDDGVYDGDNSKDDQFNKVGKENIKNKLKENDSKYCFRYLNNCQNQMEIIIDSGGEHSFKSQYLKEKAYFVLISMILSSVINNSLRNNRYHYQSIELITKNIEDVIIKCSNWEKSNISKEELEELLDDLIKYIGVEKERENSNMCK